MIIYENRTDKTFNKELLEKIALYLCDRDIELILTSDEEIQEVNRMHRGINKATVALANKLARIGWVILARNTVYKPMVQAWRKRKRSKDLKGAPCQRLRRFWISDDTTGQTGVLKTCKTQSCQPWIMTIVEKYYFL